MGKTHFVEINRPEIGSDLYLVYACGRSSYYALVSIASHRPAMTTEKFSTENLIQGSVEDCLGNKSVNHSYLTGSLDVVPQTDKSFTITETVDHRFGEYTVANNFILNGTRLGSIQVHSISDSSKVGSVSETYTTFTSYHAKIYDCGWNKGVTYEVQNEGRFDIDYSDITKSKCHETACLTTRPPYYPTVKVRKSAAVLDCSFFHLGKVTGNNFDLSCLDVPEHIVPQAPDTFLTDLYDKIGVPQVNNCDNIRQLHDWKQMVPPFKEIITKHNVKSLADLYLWWKYSYNTTKMDIEAYLNWFLSLSEQKANKDNFSHYSLTYHPDIYSISRYNVVMSPYSIGLIEALGIDINLSNTWDMLPFSFVVDWFVSIGDTLHSIDVSDLGSKVSIISIINSYKRVIPYVIKPEYSVTGTLTRVEYSRSIQHELPRRVCDVHFNNPTSHLLDGSSLFISLRNK